MTRFGVMKHLRVLEEAGLVTTRRRGREKLHWTPGSRYEGFHPGAGIAISEGENIETTNSSAAGR